jgi:protein-tyrosine-phosphatase
MAEGAMRVLLEKEGRGKTVVLSAGTAGMDDYPATDYAIEAAKLWSADISGHRSQSLTRELIEGANLIFAMTASHYREIIGLSRGAKDKTFLLKSFPEPGANGEGVDDPIGRSLQRYNETFLEIGEYLGKHLPKIVERIDETCNGD